MVVYSKKDVEDKARDTRQTAAQWRQNCIQDFREHGDRGSCVLGAGIAVYWKPDRRFKYPKLHVIISAQSVCACQGSLNWESSVDEILAYLKNNGLEAFYYPGILD